jgi:DUF4097 and DUF4098 domain-containing protein YvlB
MTYAVRSAVLGFAAALAVACAKVDAQNSTGSFRQTLTVPAALELEVTTGSGSIAIRAGAAGQAEVVGEIRVHDGFFGRSGAEAEEVVRALEADPPIELSDNRLRVGYIVDPAHRQNVSISYEITVPADTAARSRTGSGSQTHSGLAAIEAEAGSGAIVVADIHGTVRARTGSGSIRAERIGGAFTGNTGSGSVTLEQTVSAAIEISTGSGSVRIRVPQGAAFELDARTGSGAISTAHPLTIQGTMDRDALRGSAGSGGPPIRVRTGSGSVHIE